MKAKPGDVISAHEGSRNKFLLMGHSPEGGTLILNLSKIYSRYKITFIGNQANYEWYVNEV
jgi:hypothetical protein